jgi:hypothetical protein
MLVRVARLRGSWRAWVKEQGGKTEEELEEEGRLWLEEALDKGVVRVSSRKRRTTKRKQFTQVVVLGAIGVAIARSWLQSKGVEDPWSWGPAAPLALYILYAFNFTSFVDSKKEEGQGSGKKKPGRGQ